MSRFLTAIMAALLLAPSIAAAQDGVVENRPYTDLRPFHFGVVVGGNFQDLELRDVGPVTVTDADAGTRECLVTADQDRWDAGFHVGVLGELRLATHFALRLAPTLYFGTRHITFHNERQLDDQGLPAEERQNMKSVYIAADAALVFSAKRHGNRRPYLAAGLAPVLNLSARDNDYLRLSRSDVFLTAGLGCDFYLPFFKLRPELRFMYGLTNSLDTGHASRLRAPEMLPYATCADRARSKIVCLSLYFE